MSLPSINFLHLTVSETQPGQTISRRPPAHPDTMGENNTPTALKGCGVKSKPKKCKHKNLTREESKGLKALRDNPHLVIKKADKGSAVVVMNTTDYLREGYRQLEDTNFYQKIPDDITNKISDRIAQQLLKMRSLNLISDKNFEYLNI